MRVSETMTREPHVIAPETTLMDTANIMAANSVGLLPISDGERIIGMVTDRDIAVRGVASGKGPDTQVRDVMTGDVKYCYADQNIDEVARNMSDLQLQRLVVISRDKRLVGILSLSDIAKADSDGRIAGSVLREIAEHAEA